MYYFHCKEKSLPPSNQIHQKVLFFLREKPLLIVHGSEGKEKMNLQSDAMSFKNIDLVQVSLVFLCSNIFSLD